MAESCHAAESLDTTVQRMVNSVLVVARWASRCSS